MKIQGMDRSGEEREAPTFDLSHGDNMKRREKKGEYVINCDFMTRLKTAVTNTP